MTVEDRYAYRLHQESLTRFEGRLFQIASEAFAAVGERGLRTRIVRAELGAPFVTEEDARAGADDLTRPLIIVLEIQSANKADESVLHALLPVPSSSGTFIRRSGTYGSEWVLLGQIRRRPGVHFAVHSATGRRLTRIEPRYGRSLTLSVGSSGRPSIKGPFARGFIPFSAFETQAVSAKVPLPALHPSPEFVLGAAARSDLTGRLSCKSGPESHVTLEELRRLLDFARDAWPGPDDSAHLERSCVALIGDWLERAIRTGALHVHRSLHARRSTGVDLRYAFARGVERSLTAVFGARDGAGLSEWLSDINPLAVVSASRKVTQCGPDGLSPAGLSLSRRDIHRSHYGRLCAVETPESDHLGLTLFLATHARVNGEGSLETALLKSGSASARWLPPGAEEAAWAASHKGAEAYGASGDITVLTERLPTVDRGARGGQILARRGRGANSRPGESYGWKRPPAVGFRDPYPGHCLGASASLIPFIGHDDGARAMMGAKNLKQALPLVDPEPPVVATGFESMVAAGSGFVIRAAGAGTVKEIRLTGTPAVVISDETGLREYPIPLPRSTQAGTWREFVPRVSAGERVRTGQVLIEGPACRDGVLALGQNMMVAYMPWHGYNFEDGIVISQRAVDAGRLTALHAERIEVPVWADGQIEPVGPAAIDDGVGLDPEGIIECGRAIGPGTTLVRKKGKSVVADHWQHGEVASVRRREIQPGARVNPRFPSEVITIDIVARRSLCVGDKLMGRHGNKGVVARIEPEHLMPRMLDGTPIDVLLNPHGVISRMNIGQLFETHLGLLAWCRAKAGTPMTYVVPPFSTVDEGWLAPELIRHGFPRGKAVLVDGESGRHFDAPVTVGLQYIVRLNQSAEDKIAVRTTGPYSPVTEQPVRGRRRSGGQRFGEMEGWALIAHDAPELLRETTTTKSDDVLWRRDGQHRSLPESARVLTLLLRGLCIETEFQDGKVRSPLTGIKYGADHDPDTLDLRRLRLSSADEVRSWSAGEVADVISFAISYRCNNHDCRHIIDHAHYTALRVLSGGDAKRRALRCPKCKGGSLRRVTDGNSPTDKGLFSSRLFGKRGSEAYRNRFGHIDLAAPVLHPWAHCFATSPLAKIWDAERYGGTIDQYLAAECTFKGLSGVDAIRQLLKRRFRQDWLVTTLSVIPAAFREGRERAQREPKSLKARYVSVMLRNQQLRDAVHETQVTAARVALQRSVTALLGTSGSAKGSLSSLLSGKNGLLRHDLLGKRVDFSARAVIVPKPSLHHDEVGLPATMFDAFAKGAATFVDDPVVLVNRAPSLHRYSIHAARAVRHESGDVIQLPPLVCGGLNADFDGDTLAIHVPLSSEARREARLLMPSAHLHSVSNGKLMLHLTQDIVSGLFLASIDDAQRRLLGVELKVRGDELKMLGKNQLVRLLDRLSRHAAVEALASTERLMALGFNEATNAGLTLSVWDIPGLPPALVRATARRIEIACRRLRKKRAPYKVAEVAAFEATIDAAWKGLLADLPTLAEGDSPNPLAVIVHSKARGDAQQVGHIRAFRGYVSAGEVLPIDHFIDSNLRGGLPALHFFQFAHHTRRTMADKKLMTAQAGELTRWLVEACYPVRIIAGDCRKRARRRSKSPGFGPWAKTRSVLGCRELTGICQKCFASDPSTGGPPVPGLAIGVIAGQAIGESGTQLTMRTFHGAGSGPDLHRARALFQAAEPVPLGDMPARTFLAAAKNIYGDRVDSRYFEIVYRQMCLGGQVIGVREAARRRPRGGLARASFLNVVETLAELAFDAQPCEVGVDYKQRLMLGRHFRT